MITEKLSPNVNLEDNSNNIKTDSNSKSLKENNSSNKKDNLTVNTNNNNTTPKKEKKKKRNKPEHQVSKQQEPQQQQQQQQSEEYDNTEMTFSNKFGVLASDEDLSDSNKSQKKQKKEKGKHQQQQQKQNKDKKKNKNKNKSTDNNVTIVNFTNSNNEFNPADIYGKDAKVEISMLSDKRKACTVKDIQHYILWMMSDFQLSMPSWIFTRNKPLLDKLILVSIPSVSLLTYEKACLLSGRKWFQDKLPHSMEMGFQSTALQAPPSLYHNLFNIKVQHQHSNNNKNQKVHLQPAIHYVLTEDELIENGYPLARINGNMEGWVKSIDETTTTTTITNKETGETLTTTTITKTTETNVNGNSVLLETTSTSTASTASTADVNSNKKTNDNSHEIQQQAEMYALDCEMCRTKEGLELTRISIVNEFKTVILDEYVKPKNEITDYLTQYSGITASTLASVTTTLEDIQKRLLTIIKKNTILIGHSLENDLKAMKFVHERVIDTSVIYPTGSTAKFPLRYLTKKYLQRVIQNSSGGHSSIEDANAVMDLVKLKIAKGKNFGTKMESYDNFFNRLHHYKKRSTFIDTIDEINQYSTTVVSCFKSASDTQVTERAVKQVRGASDFVCMRFNQLAEHYKSIDNTIQRSLYSFDANLKSNQQEEQNLDNSDESDSTETTTTTTTSAKVDDQKQPIQNITSSLSEQFKPDIDESLVKEISQWDGIPTDQKVLDMFANIDKSISRIYEQMTNNSMMILVMGPGATNDYNRYKNDGNKQKDFLVALTTAKEGLVMIGVK